MNKRTRKYISIVVFGCLFGYMYSTFRDNRTRPEPCQLADQAITATKNQCDELKEFFAAANSGEPVSANKYYQVFGANEVRAEAIFSDKPVKIYGVISAVRIDTFENLTINLKAGYGDVRLELGKNQFQGNPVKIISAEEKMLQLDKGQKIHAVCIGGRKAFITPYLTNCIIQR